jgi:Icc-related predicted phosphoesterase
VYFASDIHASEKCWLKFLNTPKFYGAQVIIIGGDITGKFVVPIVHRNGSAIARFMGIERRADTADELKRLKTNIANAGAYAFDTTEEEYAQYQGDQTAVDDLFKRFMIDRVSRWVDIAEDRLKGTGIRCLVSGGNDDYFEVDDVLARSAVIEVPEGRVLDLVEGFQLLGVGYGNPTPWNCPRDISEAELGAKIDAVASQVGDPERAIFSLHVPPYGSGLDLAPRLDENLRVVMGGAGAEMVPVGSTAVKAALDRYRPRLALHGHIHESRGIRTQKGTTIVNPGSEYAEGILDGALIDLDRQKGVVNVQLVSG